MKKLYIISLLSILSLPAFGASATNPFDGITTVDAALEKFESESQKILDSYKKQLNNKEFKKLKELRTEILDKKPDATKDDKTTDNNATVAERKLTPEEQEQVLNHIPAYVESVSDVKYQKDFERYLRDKCFLNVVYKDGITIFDSEMPNEPQKKDKIIVNGVIYR